MALVHSAHASDGWPPLFPADVARFITPPYERSAWVAVADDGTIVGHVALHEVGDDALGDAIVDAAGCTRDQLAVLARLVTSHRVRGAGLGSRLLDTACAAALAEGCRAALDVAHVNAAAVEFYEHRDGWTRASSVLLTLPDGRSKDAWIYLGPEPGHPGGR
ncbi:MAG: GNAT family N-acetyltransferase [Acidimicrobiia bacterium]|nr:GNAT family N-acetyltransferase [Acidimicrobiia bacterium]